MKIKRSETRDGKIEMQVSVPADKVQEAIQFVNFQLAMQNGIPPQDPTKLTDIVKEKVGDAYYNSFVDYQVPNFLAPFAVTEEKLEIIGPPSVTSPATRVDPRKELSFTVQVLAKPSYEIDDFSPVQIKLPKIVVSDEEIEQQLAMLAENHITYEKDEDRPLRENDDVVFAIATVDEQGEQISQLTAERRNYTVGQGFLPGDFDSNLIGMNVGETKTFDVTSKDFNRSDLEDPEKTETFTFTITILEIQKKVIPAITDAWVQKNVPGVSTLPELREEIRKQGFIHKEQELANMKTFMAASEFAKRFKGSIPDELYEVTRDDILQNLQQQIKAQGSDLQTFIKEQAGGEQQFSMQIMMQTREVLVQGFSLDALARHLKLTLSDDDIAETFHLMAPGHEREAQMEFELSGRMYLIREGAMRNKANKWLVDNAEVEYIG